MKEIKCDNCSHLQVCALKDQFHNAQKAVDNLTVGLGDREFKELRHFDWIKPVKLECIHFSAKQTMRQDNPAKGRVFYPGMEDGTRPIEDPE